MRAGKNTNTGAKRAREARERWGLGDADPLPCVLTVAEHLARIPVIVAALPQDLAGCLTTHPVIWVNGRHAPVRRRFTVAHELGHHCCEHGPILDPVTNFSDSRDPREVQANAFAAELLMPRAGVEAIVDGAPTLEDAVRLAAHFGVSALAARHRLRALGLADERRAQQLSDEIDEGLHHEVADLLGLRWPEDVLGAIDEDTLPRLPGSLEGSALRGMLDGSTDVASASAAAGVDAATLADGLREIR